MARRGKAGGGGLMGALARPFRALGRLLGGGASRDQDAQSRERESTGPLLDDSFTMALEGLLAEEQGSFQTRLHLISLVEFREAVGDKWAKVAEKVMMIAEGVINLHLGAGNVCGRKGTDLFVLVFRNTPPAEARRRAVRIAQELGTRLMGSQFTGADRPLALAAEISLDDALDSDGHLDLAALAEAVAETRAVLPPPVAQSPRPPIAAASPEAEREREAGPRWTAMDGGGRQPNDPDWQAAQSGREDGVSIDPGLDATPPMPGDAALSLSWRPSWMAEGEVIGAYRAQVLRVDQPGKPAYEGTRAYPSLGGDTVPMLDRFIAGAAVRGIKQVMAEGSGARVVVPLHWGSLGGAARMSVLAPFADIPEAMRAQGLYLELCGLPPAIAPIALAEVVAALRPLCRAVIFRIPLLQPRMAPMAEAGGGLAAIDLAELANADKMGDEPLLEALMAARRQAHALGIGLCAWSLRRRKVVSGTVLGGFAMINGPGLMKDLPRPAKVLPAPRSRFAALSS